MTEKKKQKKRKGTHKKRTKKPPKLKLKLRTLERAPEWDEPDEDEWFDADQKRYRKRKSEICL